MPGSTMKRRTHSIIVPPLVRRIVFALLFVPVALEASARIEDWMRWGVPLTSGVTDVDDLQVTDSLGHHARPASEFRQFRIDSLGFRGPEISRAQLAKGNVVDVSGASETFGLYESEGKQWPRQLSDSLAAHCRRQVTVINSAVAGMSLPTVIQDLELRILPLKPEVVVYYPEPSGYLDTRVPRASPPRLGPPATLSPWRSRALPRLRNDVKNFLPARVLDYLRLRDANRWRKADGGGFHTVPTDRLDTMELDLRKLVGVVRRGGSKLVLVVPHDRFTDTTSAGERGWLHSWERLVPLAPAPVLLDFSRLAIERVRAVAKDSGTAIVDPPFPTDSTRPSYFADAVHFTDKGSGLVAGATSKVLSTILKCGG